MDSEKKYFAHETAVVDEGCEIGNGFKTWHFSHIMPSCRIGNNCNPGQNVVSPNVALSESLSAKQSFGLHRRRFGLEETRKAIELVQQIRNHPKNSVLRANP